LKKTLGVLGWLGRWASKVNRSKKHAVKIKRKERWAAGWLGQKKDRYWKTIFKILAARFE
jgi:hypothetical protein